VDVHVLDHCGNLGDACVAASLAALMAFRKPQVEFVGDGRAAELVVHSVEEREPTPLSIHHLPIAVTFALYEARARSPVARRPPPPPLRRRTAAPLHPPAATAAAPSLPLLPP
jgi:hypothetical protein